VRRRNLAGAGAGLAVVVDGIHVGAQVQQDLNGLQHLALGAGIFAGRACGEAGGKHERRAVVGIHQRRIGPQLSGPSTHL
jgi:hypothetical protein